MSEQASHDPISHPAHYTGGEIECIDAIRAALGRDGFIAFLRGQVIKYQWRLLAKGDPAQDAGKANWYGRKLEEVLREEGPAATATPEKDRDALAAMMTRAVLAVGNNLDLPPIDAGKPFMSAVEAISMQIACLREDLKQVRALEGRRAA